MTSLIALGDEESVRKAFVTRSREKSAPPIYERSWRSEKIKVKVGPRPVRANVGRRLGM